MTPSEWPLAAVAALFLAATAVIVLAGIPLTRNADAAAARTGLGEAAIGAILLGAITSLPGITASVSAAWAGNAELALSNAYGGIAAQTFFMVVADMAFRRANLEHAAASLGNLMWATLLIVLLAMLLLVMTGASDWTWGWFHPVSPILIAVYLFGMRWARDAKEAPMWVPHQTDETRTDDDEGAMDDAPAGTRLWVSLAVYGFLVAVAGWLTASTGGILAARTGLSATVVGALLVAVATSLPELVTSVTAIRRGAIVLAVGGILGGNAFDTLFAAAADFAYREGSIYAAVTVGETRLLTLTLLMTAIFVFGMLSRERRGVANIGFESTAVFVTYVGGMLWIAFG